MHDTNFKPQAFLFDLNGTMINDMHFHAEAWYRVLTDDLGAALTFEDVKKEMYGKNEELLVRIFGNDYFEVEKMQKISLEKEKRYQEAFSPHLELIAGLAQFLEKAHQAGIKMAIGSAAIPFNIDFVLDGLEIRDYFSAIVSADDVKVSKPDAETFTKAAAALQIDPSLCLVFEDVPKGVEAARRAGMKCIVVTTTHRKEEFAEYDNILEFIEDYNHPHLNNLI